MNRFLRNFMIGGIIGLVLVLFAYVLQIDVEKLVIFIVSAGVIAVIFSMLFNYLYYRYYLKQLHKISDLLEQKPKQYIKEIHSLLQKAKGKQARIVLKTSLALGYMQLHDFEEAIDLLEEAYREKSASKQLKAMLLVQLTLCYFYNNQQDLAFDVIQENKQLFDSYRGHHILGADLALLDIYGSLAKEDYECAEKSVNRALKMWTDKSAQLKFLKIKDFVKEKGANKMEKKLKEMMIEKTKQLIDAPTVCAEAKQAALNWLEAIGSDNEKAMTENYLQELKEDIVTSIQLKEFALSDAGAAVFGSEAQSVAAHASELIEKGILYCDCPACQIVEEILKLEHEIMQ